MSQEVSSISLDRRSVCSATLLLGAAMALPAPLLAVPSHRGADSRPPILVETEFGRMDLRLARDHWS